MGRTGIIMGFFVISATTFSILENMQHVDRLRVSNTQLPIAEPAPVIARSDTINNSTPYISDELCCTEVDVKHSSLIDLKRELSSEQHDLDELKKLQKFVDKQLLTVYQRQHQIEKIAHQYGSEQAQQALKNSNISVGTALRKWAEHNAQIEYLARINSRDRLKYIPDATTGYLLNESMNKDKRANDYVRAALNIRLQYLNEVYRQQNLYLQRHTNPSAWRSVANLPAYP